MFDDFQADGALAKAIAGFSPRQAQQQMATAVAEVIEHNQQLIVEAGTGIGKTYAYLVPALRSGKKVIISTASKALQDQLYRRDIPTIVRALAFTGKIALLKGRGNYLCLLRFEQQNHLGGDLITTAQDDLVTLRSWRQTTVTGDINTCSGISEDSQIWPLVTSTVDNCLGSECSYFKDCYVVKARKRAMEANIVIINHHLFLADRVVRERGFAELVPKGEVFVFDEAHQLPDTACHYFGEQVTSRQLSELAKRLLFAYQTELSDERQLKKVAERLVHCVDELRLTTTGSTRRGDLRQWLQEVPVASAIRRLKDTLELCYDIIKEWPGRSTLLDTLFAGVVLQRSRLERITATQDPAYSYWYEVNHRHITLALTPLHVAEQFNDIYRQYDASWIFASATLSVNQTLAHFAERMGLATAIKLMLDSPFDYMHQALLYVPRFLPPISPQQSSDLAQMIQPLIEANHGRCFFLCTSHQMMRELAEQLQQRVTFPVLMQGKGSKTELINAFVDAGNAVLVATSSFWEGVDMRGDILSLVIIDKLPFTSPDEPLLKARMAACHRQGMDPFSAIQLPDAVLALKQGAGRLIRDQQDRGVLVICDQRLVSRPYGALFLASLPSMSRTRDLARTLKFIHEGDFARD